MPSLKKQRDNYRLRTKLEAKHNAAQRELANEIFELKNKLLFAEQPYKVQIDNLKIMVRELEAEISKKTAEATHMLLWCPECHERHIDEGAFSTKGHRTHACQHCGMVWRPSLTATIGVRYLPGYGPR